MASVRVAVRVRPLDKREQQLSCKVVTRLEGNTVYLYKPSSVRESNNTKIFSYDFLYESDERSPSFASQERIFNDLGQDVLKSAFEGFNTCVFSYGQTGSGKSYTMMGDSEQKGLIPQICEALFSKISERSNSRVSFRAVVSFMEIYNERVHDLLKKRTAAMESGNLRVREHPRDGPYVENLSKHLVHSYSDVEELIAAGNTNRITVSTAMNDTSSRSHAIFTINFTQAWFDAELPREMLSKIHLVDLAGSERANATYTSGVRLKEGANINKSLVTLGNVISALAELSVGPPTTRKSTFVPYRDSVLTWLLKDSLGGNSKTTMIATISPADVNYGETLSTLRYANRAQNIVNTPTVNEDKSVKLIRELQAEVTRLKRLLQTKQVSHRELSSSLKVEEELLENEEKVYTLTKEWTCKWEETQGILQEEPVALKREGSAVVLDCQFPHLIGMDEDLLSTGIVLYYLKEGRTVINTNKATHGLDIEDAKPGADYCVFENYAGTVTVIPHRDAMCSVNGTAVTQPCQLTQGAIIHLGGKSILRFNHPTEAAYLREKQQRGLLPMNTLPPKLKSSNLPEMILGISSDFELPSSSTVQSKLVTCLPSFAAKDHFTLPAIPGKGPVPHAAFDLDEGTQKNGVSTGADLKQEIVLCHKSWPERMSEHPWREAENAAQVSSYTNVVAWSGEASLQQTSVLGPGDGCVIKPEGNANEIQGVVAHCIEGGPDSGGSSLDNISHLHHTGGSRSRPVPPHTDSFRFKQNARHSREHGCPSEETSSEGELNREDVNGFGFSEDSEAALPSSRLNAFVNGVSGIIKDARHFLWSSPPSPQQFEEERKKPFVARWSNRLVSLVKESRVMSVIDSQVLSIVNESRVFSYIRSRGIYSMVQKLPLIQHIQAEIMEHLWANEATSNIHDYNYQHTAPMLAMSQTQNISSDLFLDTDLILEDKSAETDEDQESDTQRNEIKKGCLSLVDYPDALVNLQNCSFHYLKTSIESVLSSTELLSQNIVALYWMNVAKPSLPEPCPGLLVLSESCLYTLTAESGPLELFHQLPFSHLQELQISFSGHGLRLMGTTQETILGMYTHNQKLTQEVYWAILDILCPGVDPVSQHLLLNDDWTRVENQLSLDTQTFETGAGLRVCCQFQKSLADLLYLLYCNMEEGTVSLGELQLLLYTSVKVSFNSSTCSGTMTQLLLTDTHIGLVQEDVVFYPPPRTINIQPCHQQFRDLTLRQRADVHRVVVHEDECEVVGLDLIFTNVRARGQPKFQHPTLASNSPPHAEVWKLTFSCSTEAACLINYLSNV
ncbi:uncharacterized protein kif16bb [Stigmatopora argus]